MESQIISVGRSDLHFLNGRVLSVDATVGGTGGDSDGGKANSSEKN